MSTACSKSPLPLSEFKVLQAAIDQDGWRFAPGRTAELLAQRGLFEVAEHASGRWGLKITPAGRALYDAATGQTQETE
jgi:hypothetical protein